MYVCSFMVTIATVGRDSVISQNNPSCNPYLSHVLLSLLQVVLELELYCIVSEWNRQSDHVEAALTLVLAAAAE